MNVNFYILSTSSGQKSLIFACQLVEKCYAEKKKVYIHTRSREDANRFDALLWVYHDDSFLPHPSPEIQIGCSDTSAPAADIFLNLSGTLPTFVKAFDEVIEIVFSDPLVQQLGRERYKQYREYGCEINTHKISNEHD